MPLALNEEGTEAVLRLLDEAKRAFEAGELEGLILIPIRSDAGGVGSLAGPPPLLSHQLRMAELNLMLNEIAEAQKRASAAAGIFIHAPGRA